MFEQILDKEIPAQCPGCGCRRNISRGVSRRFEKCEFALVTCDRCNTHRSPVQNFAPLWFDSEGRVINSDCLEGMLDKARQSTALLIVLNGLVGADERLLRPVSEQEVQP